LPSEYPVIVGAGQITNRARDLSQAREPLDLMAEAARKAEGDAGGRGLLAKVDSVRVVSVLSWPSQDPPADLAGRVGAPGGDRIYTTIGGNTPQWLVNETAEAIAKGTVRLALLAGAESMHSLRLARKAGQQPDWSPRGRPKASAGDTRFGVSELEHLHGASQAITVYPLFENALRAHYGRSIEEHRRALGELCARFTQVAAQHPNAWFPQARSGPELATASAENRMVGFPYPKYMNAIMDVDQSAALIMTSASTARELGIPEDRWVYLHGCGDATEHWYVTERVNYHSAPAIRAAGRRALSMAGVVIDDIAAFDLYSCFPSAVQLGRDALGIAQDDPRALTVTGGLPYFGGPGNNYTMHGIATMAGRLRERRDELGLVSGLGWWATKHAIGVYSAHRPTKEWSRTNPKVDQAEIDAMPHPELVAAADGAATIETYTVTYDRDGAPALGIVIGRLEDGRRFIANVLAEDRALLEAMPSREFVGEHGAVRHDASTGINRFSA
jgi:acetyl-CoA C-acetyltransferase